MHRSPFALLAALLVSLVASPARADLRDAVRALDAHREGRVIVKYREAVPEVEKDHHCGRRGSRAERKFPAFGLESHRLRPGLSVAEAIAEYEADPEVEYAEPDYLLHAQTVPNDAQWASLWSLTKMKAPSAWDQTTGSRDVVVAVIDSGIDYNHPDLKDNLWVNAAELNGRPGVDDDGDRYVDNVYGYNTAGPNTGDPFDDDGHGTHVAGIIGAVGDNRLGVAGINWNVQIMACKFLDAQGSGSTSDAIQCLEYVRAMKAKGVNVVATNNSWGGGPYQRALYDAIRAQQEILFVCAAGNSATDNDVTDDYPANYDLPNVISVAATGQSDALASFSSYGRYTVHVGAPGVQILSTVPLGTGSGGGDYGSKSGTSMAAPFVAGLAALLKAGNPSLDWRGIKNRILAGADPVAGLKGKTLLGARVNAANSMACRDRVVLAPINAPVATSAGVPVTVSALSVRCEAAEGPVTARLSTGDVLDLRDDGMAPDLAAGDGVFTRRWTPATAASVVSVSNGSSSVSTVDSLTVATASLPHANEKTPYDQTLSAAGGIPPYSWRLTSGALPTALTVDAGGRIQGVPAQQGTFPFTVQLTDGQGTTVSKALSLAVLPEGAPSGLGSSVGGGGGGGGGCFIAAAAEERPPAGACLLALFGFPALPVRSACRRLFASRRAGSA